MNEYYAIETIAPRPLLVGGGFSNPVYRIIDPDGQGIKVSSNKEFLEDFRFLLNDARNRRESSE